MAYCRQDNPSANIRAAALNALARREHSREELSRKLSARFGDHQSLINGVLDRLADEGLQSDSRFAEAYCRAKSQCGYGQRYILNALKSKGVSENDWHQAAASLELDWFALALNVLNKKFGDTPIGDMRDKARRVRFLQYRGFTGDQIRYALEHGEQD
jgi:regulatory protein